MRTPSNLRENLYAQYNTVFAQHKDDSRKIRLRATKMHIAILPFEQDQDERIHHVFKVLPGHSGQTPPATLLERLKGPIHETIQAL
jgi:hypothetical protein